MIITANDIVRVGLGRVEEDRIYREVLAESHGHHKNAYKLVGKNDILFAKELVDKGFGHAELRKPGMWFIDDLYYFPSTRKWTTNTQKPSEQCEGFDDFIEKILKISKK